MEYTENGRLTVRTYAASGGYPVGDAIVRIRGTDEENRFEEYSLITDENGLTETILLPTPSKAYSLQPKQPEIPFARYNVDIEKVGYYSKRIYNVSVFSGIDSYLPVNMIPQDNDSVSNTRPSGNLNAIVTQNDKLN